MIKIVCDSISDLPIEIIKKYDIEIVPLTVLFNGIEYLDGKNLTCDKFYKMLRETSSMPKHLKLHMLNLNLSLKNIQMMI